MDRYVLFLDILNLLDENYSANITDAQMKNFAGDIFVEGLIDGGWNVRITAEIVEAENG